MSIQINIAEVLNTRYPVSEEQAQPLYQQLTDAIANSNKASLSFKNIETCSTIFLNFMLGKLYKNYGSAVDDLVVFTDIDQEDDILSEQLARTKHKALSASHNRIVEFAIRS